MEYQLIGKSKAVENLRRRITQLGASSKDVLIVGELGSGRGTAARELHVQQFGGLNGDHPFITINASVLEDREFEATLFGFEKGAPGMPPTTKRGAFEMADGGTLLIEDVDELSFRNQMHILSFLETRTAKRLGATTGSPVRVRLILTMKHPIEELIEENKLYDKFASALKGFELLNVPALRERPEDIPILAKYFVSEICRDLGIKEVVLDINAIDILVRQPWRENIRELKAVIDKAILFSSGGKFVLPPELTDEKTEIVKMLNNIEGGQAFVLENSLDVIERGIIERALNKFGFNQSRAAAFLGMTEQTLRYKLKRLGIASARQRR